MSSIKRRDNGSWRARYRDDAGKEHARHFDRKIDGQRWLDEVTAGRVTGTYVSPAAGKVTLRAFYLVWAERQIWETGTRRAMDLAVRSCTFEGIELRALKRSHVESWVKSMSNAGLAPLTIHGRVRNVRSVLRAAVRDRALSADPSEGVSLPRKRRADMAMDIPAPEDVRRLYEAAEDWFKPVVALAAFAGLRLGELNGLQLADIDFLPRSISVIRQVQRTPGMALEIRPPKYGSERVIPVPDSLLLILSRHVEQVGVYGDAGWLLPGRDGGPIWPRTIAYHWDRLTAKVGLKGVRLHDLRHFYASGLIASGCDVVTVQRALGHRSASVTLNTYSHLWPNADDRTRSASQALMAGALSFTADSLRTADV
ncbi:tyrosine-type recombinase/integrase [Cryobacterium sp. TMT4-31]|uniref:tyrosine-type recombinase/integrase n=1 Tax=Cryobacterium sp. TMT4-31 TaxID=1259259 RepID=UPI0010697B60|nr:tyrosine-type recombinase/integrase [Cryobacterium sp. TMT4-31]TFC84853.1 site-specific integrase [Cryobacterium sp. TMT4-31]